MFNSTFGSTKASLTAAPFTLSTSTPASTATGTLKLGVSPLATNTTASGLTFGTSTTSAVPSGFGSGFKFGSSSTATSSASSSLGQGFSLGGGGGLGSSLTASTASAGLGTTSQPTTSAPAFKGLGGTSSGASSSSQNGNGNKGTGVSQALKDQTVPPELCKDVEQFGEFVKKQKEESAEVGKFSVRSLHKIREEMSSLSHALGSVSSALHRNKAAVQRLREDFTRELQHVEMAQRTQDTPPSMQHDNIAPVKFFMNMVMEFEASMLTYRRQIEELENHLNSYNHNTSLTPQDIYLALCKMQDSFISLAANMHSIHDQVKNLKEQYLVYRRIVHGETVDIFSENRRKNNKGKPNKTAGLSPFNQLSNVAALAMASMVDQHRHQQQTQQGPPQQGFLSTQMLGGGGGGLFASTSKPTGTASLFGGASANKLGGFGTAAKPSLSAGFASTSSSSLFGNSSFNTSAGLTFGGAATGSTFELKKPPVGNKRGKK